MLGLMMDTPLLTTDILRYAATAHGETEIVSRNADGSIHRTCYSAAKQRCQHSFSASRLPGFHYQHALWLVHEFDIVALQQPVSPAQLRRNSDLPFARNFHTLNLTGLERKSQGALKTGGRQSF